MLVIITHVKVNYCVMRNFVQGTEGDDAVKLAISSPEKYVLKPQREGGGKYTNIY